MSSYTDLFCVSVQDSGVRLDKLLSDHFPAYSRTYFQYLIEQGSVLVNGSGQKTGKAKTRR